MGQAGSVLRGDRKDSEKLESFYSELFGWQIATDNGERRIVQRDGNTTDEGKARRRRRPAQEGSDGWLTFYVASTTSRPPAEGGELGGTRVMGPIDVPGGPQDRPVRGP